MKELTVDDLMSACPITIDERQSLLDAERLMTQHEFQHLPVTRGGEFVGLVTQRDLLKASSLANRVAGMDENLKATIPVRTLARREVAVVRSDLSGRAACQLMLREKLGCLPVVDSENRIVGIITHADFSRLALLAIEALSTLESQRPSVRVGQLVMQAA